MTQRASSWNLNSTRHYFRRFHPDLIVIKLLMAISIIQAMTTASMTSILFPDSSEENRTNPVQRLCPKKSWFHNETKSCWPSKAQGPCPPSLLFYSQDKTYGDCECPRDDATHSTVWVYDLESNSCFKSYQQAFCKSGQWLIFDANGEPVCVPNKCEEMQQEKPDENKMHPVVLYNDVCVRLSKSTEKGNCSSPFVIIIHLLSGKPICSSDLSNRGIGSTSDLKCRRGTRRDRLGKCRPVNSK